MNLDKAIICSAITFVHLYSQDINKLDDVVITATKTQNSIKDVTTAVQVIGKEEIENSGASSLGEILNNNASIYVSPRGTSYKIRGMEHSDTLILIDGKRVIGEFSKSFELQRISAGMIEKIEILKGSSSLLYGSDAMGGVINIITKKAKDKIAGTFQLTLGENKKAGDFFVSGKKDDTSFSLYSNYLKQDAYTKNKTANVKVMQGGVAKSPSALSPSNAYFNALKNSLNDSYMFGNDYLYNQDIKNIGGRLSHDFSDELSLSLDFAYLKEEKDGSYLASTYPTGHTMPNGTTLISKNIPAYQYNENDKISLGANINYFISDNMQIDYDISYSKYDKNRKSLTPLYSELGYSSLEDSAFSVNVSTLKHLDNALQFTHTIDETNRYILGADYRINDTKSTAFIVDDRTYTSFYAQHEYKLLENLKLIYGARYDETSEDESNTSLSFGGVYSLNENISFRANYSEGFRSPDDRELYVDQTNPAGKGMLGSTVINSIYGKTNTTELKSETSKTLELGMLADYEDIGFEISLYETQVDDRISQVMKNSGSYITFENIDDTKIKGAEASISFSAFEDLMVRLNLAYTDAKNKDTNENLLEVPKKLAGLTLSYYPADNIELKSITKYVGSQNLDTDKKVGGYTITNLKVNVEDIFENTDLFAGVDNIFDKKTNEELGLIPQSYFYTGIKYKF